ncbi:MAG: hypothetical protein QM758_18295 [Armatimonas sp.]
MTGLKQIKCYAPAFSRDLTHEREKVKQFFEAWFGGSRAYFDRDWPPGLTAAHAPVSISRGMAGRWVGHFLDAFAEAVPDPALMSSVKPLIGRLHWDSSIAPTSRYQARSFAAEPTVPTLDSCSVFSETMRLAWWSLQRRTHG